MLRKGRFGASGNQIKSQVLNTLSTNQASKSCHSFSCLKILPTKLSCCSSPQERNPYRGGPKPAKPVAGALQHGHCRSAIQLRGTALAALLMGLGEADQRPRTSKFDLARALIGEALIAWAMPRPFHFRDQARPGTRRCDRLRASFHALFYSYV